MLHLILALLTAVFTLGTASAAPLVQSDPLVKKAADRVTEVEKGEAALVAGDAPGANKLLNRLAWAEKRLGAVVQQGTAEWKAAKTRHDAVKAKIEKKKAAPKPAPKPGPAPPGKGPVKKPGTGAGGTPPPSTPPSTGKVDIQKLTILNDAVNQSYDNLKLLQFKHFLDANRVNGLRKEIEKFEAKLATYPAGDANVKIVTSNLKNLRSLYQLGVDRIEADRKTAPEITKRLDGMFDKYSTEKFSLLVEPPYNEVQLRAWAREVHDRLDVKLPADLAWIDSVSSNVVVGSNRFSSVRHNLTFSIQSNLEGAKRGVSERLDGEVHQGVEHAQRLLKLDPKDEQAITNYILGEGAFDENMVVLRTALFRVGMASILDEEMKRANPPSRKAQAQKIELGIGHLEELAKLTLSEVRMPKAASTDAELLKVAKETLALEKYEIEGWERLVINSERKEHQRREAWFEPGTVTSTISFYDYSWSQFQVTTAEKVGDEVWLFANTLKLYSSGDRTTPVGDWILSQRFKLTPILAENVDK